MRRKYLTYLIISTCINFLLITGCSSKNRSLDEIRQSGKLYVLTVNSETTYFEDRDGRQAGFEYEMVNHFAKYLGVKAHFIVKSSTEELLEALDNGKGDMIASGMTITEDRQEEYEFGPAYQETQQKLVCRKGVQPKNIEELQTLNIIIGAETSYVDSLERMKEKFPKLAWSLSSRHNTPQLIKEVHLGNADCTISDSHILQIYRRYFPDLEVPMDVGEPQSLAWVFPDGSSTLVKQADEWFEGLSKIQLSNWKETYYSFVQEFDPFEIRKFTERIKTRLPQYRKLLQKAAREYGWPWELLAAISYQESHWDPNAKSATGVRGFMMLTQATAEEVGVTNRLDVEQSIMGGVKYLTQLEQRIPPYISERDRKWMTLAAYNVGFAHLRDARGVAAWRNRNPNTWQGVRAVLPLLSSKSTYQRLPHGYARGLEPVLYVDRIKNYLSLLKRQLAQ